MSSSRLRDATLTEASLKLEINKWNLASNGKKLERQKCADVRRDLDASWSYGQPVNKLITFLGNCQKQRNEKKYYRSGREQEFASRMLETEHATQDKCAVL